MPLIKRIQTALDRIAIQAGMSGSCRQGYRSEMQRHPWQANLNLLPHRAAHAQSPASARLPRLVTFVPYPSTCISTLLFERLFIYTLLARRGSRQKRPALGNRNLEGKKHTNLRYERVVHPNAHSENQRRDIHLAFGRCKAIRVSSS